MPAVVLVQASGRARAVPADLVREIATLPSLTPVPTAPARILGLTTLRGQILPVVALAPTASPPRPGDPLVVLEDAQGPWAALAVDEVRGVVADSDAEPLDVAALFAGLLAEIR